jgi:isoleucyl-tRNA synthetase
MYCDAKNASRRRSAQTVMSNIFYGITCFLAPILPYTAEEAWQFRGNKSSVHCEHLPSGTPHSDEIVNHWKILLEVRNKVNEALEKARREKKIGKSLEAQVELSIPGFGSGDASIEIAKCEELFIVSKVVIKPTEGEETITVTRAEDHGMKKCVRCWKYYDHVGSHAEHPELCDRCTKVVVDLKF